MGLKKTAGSFEDLIGRRPSHSGEITGHDTRFSGPAGMKWLGHGAEVFAKAAALASSDPERPYHGIPVEISQMPYRACRSKGAAGCGCVKTMLVVTRRNGFSNFTLHINTYHICGDKLPAAEATTMRFRKSGRKAWGGRMGEKSV